MKSVLVRIEPKMLNWIKQYVKENFNSEELLDELETWDNINKPRFTDIEKMSNKIHIPFGDFVLETPPKDSDIIVAFHSFFKNSSNSMSFELKETIKKMEYIQAWMEEYLIDNNFKPLEYVGSGKELNKLELTELARNILGISENWFKNFTTSYEAFTSLRSSFENIGIMVMLNSSEVETGRSLDSNECRAFVLNNSLAPLIFINNNNFKDRIFSMLVEFIHILLGQNHLLNKWTNSESEEKLCYEVAGNLVNLDSLIEPDLINQKNTKRDQYQVNFNTQNFCLDNRFKEAIINSINNGDLSFTDAFSMTDTNNGTFDEIVSN